MTAIKVRDGATIWREVDGETIVLALQSSRYLGLNRTGTVLWPTMVEGTTTMDLIDLLVSRFAIDRDRAESDVAAFVGSCRARGLLEP
ncbi:MAG: PqqD family protein [Egibacteraceae bacterium]